MDNIRNFYNHLVENPAISRIVKDKISPREKTWMWLNFRSNGFNVSYQEFNKDYVENLKNKNMVLGQITGQYEINFIDERHFDWIADNARQTKFLLKKIEESNMLPVNFEQLLGQVSNNLSDHITAAIDYSAGTLNLKIQFLDILKTSWEEITQTDKALNWFNKGDSADKINFAWEWIIDSVDGIQKNCAQPKNHYELLIIFDFLDHTHIEKLFFINSMRKIWTQRKYRENLQDKKQYNFVLTKKAIAGLDKIAKKYEISRTQALEILLRMESIKDSHIRERLELIKASLDFQ